jgi:D-alanyl-D-alanine carboxypeptidase
MILNIHKSRIIIIITLLVLINIYITKQGQASITVPYSPQVDILMSTSTGTRPDIMPLLNSGDSPTLSINAIKVWQENGDFNRKLKRGSYGNDVMVLQIILKSLTNDKTKWSITNRFGPKTESALRAVQAKLNIPVTGELDEETRVVINNLVYKELCPTAVRKIGVDNMVESDFNKVFENLNRSKAVPLNYIPQDLTRVSSSIKTIGVMCVSDRIVRHLEEMIADAKKQKLDIAITSSYRSAEMQKFLYSMWINKSGNAAKAGIAEAGHSEHQLGTTIDVSGKSIGYAGVSPRFANSKEGKWMAQNSYKYGFIMSYPNKKQKETGYIYEPWHFRFIGVDNANDIFTEKITIQNFLNFSIATTSTSTVEVLNFSTSTETNASSTGRFIDINPVIIQ